jgi:hypothetical protein
LFRECAQGSEAGYRGDFAILGHGNPTVTQVAKKCKILKVTFLVIGGIDLSL